MKAVLFFIIFSAFLIAPFSTEEIPQILIEGTEEEKITESESMPSRIMIEEEDVIKEKIFEIEKLDISPKKEKNSFYNYRIGLGTRILADIDFEAMFLKQDYQFSPYFKYHHFYPYLNKRYYESYGGGAKFNLNIKRVHLKTSFDAKGSYYEYSDDVLSENDNYRINADLKTVIDGFRIENLMNLQYFSHKNVNAFIERGLSNKLKIDHITDFGLKIETLFDIHSFSGHHPVYNVQLNGNYLLGNSVVSLGIATFKYNGSSLRPLFGIKAGILEGFFLIIENDIAISEKNTDGIIPLRVFYATTKTIKNSNKVSVLWQKNKIRSEIGIIYDERYDDAVFQKNDDIYIASSQDLYSTAIFTNLLFPLKIVDFSLKTYFLLSQQKKQYEFIEIGIHRDISRLRFSFSLRYQNTFRIENYRFSPCFLHDAHIGFEIFKPLFIGLGYKREYLKLHENANDSIYFLITGVL